MVNFVEGLELISKRAYHSAASKRIAPLMNRYNTLLESVNSILERSRLLHSELQGVNAELVSSGRTAGGGTAVLNGAQHSVMESLHVLCRTQSSVLQMTVERRWLLAGTVALSAERAQRKAIARMKPEQLVRESAIKPNTMYASWGPRALAVHNGHEIAEILALEANGTLSQLVATPKPGAGTLAVEWSDLGVGPQQVDTFKKAIGGPALVGLSPPDHTPKI